MVLNFYTNNIIFFLTIQYLVRVFYYNRCYYVLILRVNCYLIEENSKTTLPIPMSNK